MKKLIVFLSLMLFQAFAFGQVHEIFSGIAPSGHWQLKDTKSKEVLLSHSYSISKPAIHIGYCRRKDESEVLDNEFLVDLFYAKESLIGQTPLFSMENSHFALHAYKGYTLCHGKRVQLPLYLGIGLSYYSQPVPTKLLLDIDVRARIRLYVTNTIALYVGGYFTTGIHGNKEYIDLTVFHSGLETGLLFNFY